MQMHSHRRESGVRSLGIEGCWRCPSMSIISKSKVKTSHGARLGPYFSADSLPVGLRVDLPCYSSRSRWVPESEAASLHLHHPHSTSSHLLSGNNAVTAHRCTYMETSAKHRESSWLHRCLGVSCQKEMPGPAPSSAGVSWAT